MYIHVAEEGYDDHWAFMKSLRASGIFVHEGGVMGYSPSQGIQCMITGDEEAMQYFFDLWQNGYRGEPTTDTLLQTYIQCGQLRYAEMATGNTGIQR